MNFILRMLSWLSLIMPVLSLAVWSAGLIIRSKDFHMSPIGGICVALVGLALMFVIFAVFKIKWDNYQFKVLNGVCLFLGFALFTCY
jgi:hypothetical protein